MGSVVKNCLCCGKDISNRREAAKYCSARCRELAWRQKHQTVSNVAVCIYNEGVNCEDRQCSRCGWNPAVEKQREEASEEAQKMGYGNGFRIEEVEDNG